MALEYIDSLTKSNIEEIMINLAPSEISKIIRQQLENYDQEVGMNNLGKVLQIGDGIARVHGLSEVMAGELLELR